ncbi:PASTA domain-containing protein [candidate division KSB1 bacterium]|nr:PASTA domain-containing protein [candidate division KSB1 bacterium]
MFVKTKWFKLIRFFIFLFLLLIFLYVIFDQIIMPVYTRHGQEIIVPDLTNLFFEDAREKLQLMGLKIVEETKKFDVNNIFPIGVVMTQTPKSDSKVKKGRRIYVIVSKGEPSIEMPDLVTKSERNATFLLKNKGLELGEIIYEFSDVFPAGVVADQNIPPATEIKPGMIVDLTISSGRFPDKFIVPDIVNRNLKDAKKIIFQSGLTLGAISFESRNDLLPETVITQSVQPNLEVTQGDTINLIVSKLPLQIEDELE